MRITEVYPERQGRPFSPETRDLETGQTSLYHTYIALKEEYTKVEKLLEDRLDKLIQLMVGHTIELKQIKLHLASMSDEPIDEDSEEVE